MKSSQITDEISRLSVPQKLILAQDIWDSIALDSDHLPMPEWQKKELEKRYAQFKDGQLGLHSWQDVHGELRDRYK